MTSLYESVYSAGANFIKAYNQALPINIDKCDRLLLCGMGGSGISGDYIKSLNKNNIQIIVVKDYKLPNITPGDVAICTSYSGNTEETLTLMKELHNKNIPLYLVTSGGKMREYAHQNEIPVFQLPENYQPRMAFPFIFGTVYKLLSNILKFETISQETETKIIENSKKLENDKDYLENIALILTQKTPIILTSNLLSQVALRFRCQLNENSKLYAFNYTLPEFSHNGIVGIDGKKGKEQTLVLLQARKDQYHRTNIHFDFYENDIKELVHEVISINTTTNSFLEQLLELTWKLDFVSIAAAYVQKIDPLTVPSIVKLKLKLKDHK